MEQTTEEQTMTENAKTEEKKQSRYMAVLMADKGEGIVKKYFIDEEKLQILGVTAAIFVVVTMFSLLYGASSGRTAKAENVTLHAAVEELELQNSQLNMQNRELSGQVLLLSETVNQKVQAEEDAVQKAIPSGFPLAGIAKILEEEQTKEDGQQSEEEQPEEEQSENEQLEEEQTEKEQEVIFEAAKGSTVIAAGSGTIVSIIEDEIWGRILEINHDNGYISIYKVDEKPKVREEDEITRGTLLFEITSDGAKIGYQLIQDGVYIDPMELMQISG